MVAILVFTLGATKAVRLSWLFWVILKADSADRASGR